MQALKTYYCFSIHTNTVSTMWRSGVATIPLAAASKASSLAGPTEVAKQRFAAFQTGNENTGQRGTA